jgi:hypothetical protein
MHDDSATHRHHSNATKDQLHRRWSADQKRDDPRRCEPRAQLQLGQDGAALKEWRSDGAWHPTAFATCSFRSGSGSFSALLMRPCAAPWCTIERAPSATAKRSSTSSGARTRSSNSPSSTTCHRDMQSPRHFASATGPISHARGWPTRPEEPTRNLVVWWCGGAQPTENARRPRSRQAIPAPPTMTQSRRAQSGRRPRRSTRPHSRLRSRRRRLSHL